MGRHTALQQRVGKVSAPISHLGRTNETKSLGLKLRIAALFGVSILIIGYIGHHVLNIGVSTSNDSGKGNDNVVAGVRGSSNNAVVVPTKKYSHNFPEPPLTDKDGTRYHVVFSTSCSDLTHWQSYLLFYQALKMQQIGTITRIASSCTDEEQKKEQEWHDKHIRSQMSDRFKIHFTPHFMNVKNEDGSDAGKEYKYFNKPFGLKHWMEHGEGMGVDPATGKMIDEDVVVILLDPDMALMRPITADFSDDKSTIIAADVEGNTSKRVQHGYPYAQQYAFGGQPFIKIDVEAVTGKNSPALTVGGTASVKNYPVGPPYIATARDMYAIATKWSEFVPEVHKQYPKLLAEMFAFSIAAAHLKLPHIVMDHLMVSYSGMDGEGFSFITDIPDGEVCKTGYNPIEYGGPLPNVIHFCQRYVIGEWMFAKHRPALVDFFTCDSPLLQDPPMDLENTLHASNPEDGSKKDFSSNPTEAKKIAKRNAFMVCGLSAAMNEAGELFKRNHCGGNGKKTLKLYDTFDRKKF